MEVAAAALPKGMQTIEGRYAGQLYKAVIEGHCRRQLNLLRMPVGLTMAHLLIQLAQLVGQVPALCVAAVDVADPLPLSVAQAKQLLPLLELLCLQACQLL